jgi:hypothetical protein
MTLMPPFAFFFFAVGAAGREPGSKAPARCGRNALGWRPPPPATFDFIARRAAASLPRSGRATKAPERGGGSVRLRKPAVRSPPEARAWMPGAGRVRVGSAIDRRRSDVGAAQVAPGSPGEQVSAGRA